MFPHHFWLPVQNWMLIQCVAGKLYKYVYPYPLIVNTEILYSMPVANMLFITFHLL